MAQSSFSTLQDIDQSFRIECNYQFQPGWGRGPAVDRLVSRLREPEGPQILLTSCFFLMAFPTIILYVLWRVFGRQLLSALAKPGPAEPPADTTTP